MKQMRLFLSGLIFSIAIHGVSFAGDNTVVATYNDGVSNRSVTIGDVKKDLLEAVVYQPEITNDTNWHRDYIFRRNIALPAVVFDLASKGLTNRSEYRDEYELQYKKQYYISLYQLGRKAVEEDARTGSYPVVRIAHILLMVPRTTNVSGEDRELTAEEYNRALSERTAEAKKMLETLRNKTDIQSAFSNLAAEVSDDTGTKRRGGDVGYFTSGMMVKKFEEAAFSATRAGLMSNLVYTEYGIHLIYVIDPKKNRTVPELKRMLDKPSFQRLSSQFDHQIGDGSVTENYVVVSSNRTVIIQGKAYPFYAIPDQALILQVFNQPMTWKESVEIFRVMIPTFMKEITNLTTEEFTNQMNNLKTFIPNIRYALQKKQDQTPEFKKEMSALNDKITWQVAGQYFDKEMGLVIGPRITPEAILAYYNSNLSQFRIQSEAPEQEDAEAGGGEKTVQQTLEEAEPEIREKLKSVYSEEYIRKWMEEMMIRMKVRYNEEGLREIMEMEKENIRERLEMSSDGEN